MLHPPPCQCDPTVPGLSPATSALLQIFRNRINDSKKETQMPYAISLVLPAQSCHWLCTTSPSLAGCAATRTRDLRLSPMPPHAEKHLAALNSSNHPLSVLFIRFCSSKYQRASYLPRTHWGGGRGWAFINSFFTGLALGTMRQHSCGQGHSAECCHRWVSGAGLHGHRAPTPAQSTNMGTQYQHQHTVPMPGLQHGSSTGERDPSSHPCGALTPRWAVRHSARPSRCCIAGDGQCRAVRGVLQLCSKHRPA